MLKMSFFTVCDRTVIQYLKLSLQYMYNLVICCNFNLFLEQNTLLRSKHPELTSTIKKSTCVLAVVLFVALNIGPFRYVLGT